MKKSYLLCISILFSTSIFPQNTQWVYYTLNHSITNIAFETNYVWVGSYGNGLIRIDLNSWEKFSFLKSNSGIPENDLSYVAIDKFGNKWIGHLGKGLTKFDGTNWTNYNIVNSNIPRNTVSYITFDKDENLWMICNGLTKFDRGSWSNYYESNWVYSLALDTNDNKWVGTYSSGLGKFNGTDWTIYNSINSGLPADWVYSIAFDDSNNAWIGAWDGGLAKFDGINWTVYNTTNSDLPSDSIFCIAIDNSGNKWMGTNAGLVKFDGENWFVFNTSNSEIPENLVNAVAVDEYNNKWIGTPLGLAIYNENGIVAVENPLNTFPYEFSLSQNYPNPFNPNTSISYSLPVNAHVQIVIFDAMGKKVGELVNGFKQPGSYTVNFNGKNLSSGVYFYRITAGNFISIKKMSLVK